MTRRALLRLWADRDRRYGLARRIQLTDADVSAIRAYRLREVELIAKDDDRQVAMAILSTWRLPFSEML